MKMLCCRNGSKGVGAVDGAGPLLCGIEELLSALDELIKELVHLTSYFLQPHLLCKNPPKNPKKHNKKQTNVRKMMLKLCFTLNLERMRPITKDS